MTPTPPPPSSFVTEWGGSGIKWGEEGEDDGQFSGPRGVATDAAGNVYVADGYNYRIQKFDSNGNFVTKWGESGGADGQFVDPHGIATDSLGNVNVVDADAGFPVFRGAVARIQSFDSQGNFLSKWGEYGSADGQFDSPVGIAAGSSGNVFVADKDNDRIQKFDPNGVFIVKWGEKGEDDGQFVSPKGIATDSLDNVYVVDGDNNRVQVFDSDGRFLTKWGEYGTVNSGAEADGKFYGLSYIAIDSSDNIYVADTGNDRIQKFSPPPVRLDPPAAPSNLNVRAVDSSSIRVEWSDNSANEDGFEISNDETSATVDTNVTTYTWNGLAPGAYMCFEVRAFNSAGNSAFTIADSPDDNCATTRSTDREDETRSSDTTGTPDETSPTGMTGTTEETGPTSATDTKERGDDGATTEDEGVLPVFITSPVEETFEDLLEGRLPETGGGWAVLLLLGGALVGGGLSLVRLGRRFSR